MVDTCSICKNRFSEKDLELSHDIPMWMGGTDLNGRHYLCKDCHKRYENTIILKCCQVVGEYFQEEERIIWMKELSKHKYLYEKFKEIAKKVKEETYG